MTSNIKNNLQNPFQQKTLLQILSILMPVDVIYRHRKEPYFATVLVNGIMYVFLQ